MPKMMKLRVNPAFKPTTPAEKSALESALKKGSFDVDYQTAIENVRLSNGLYEIVTAAAATAQHNPLDLEGMKADDLKVMMLRMGITPLKQMRRAEIIKAIRQKMDAVEVVDDEDDA